MQLRRAQIKTLYHQFGAIEATHPQAVVELRAGTRLGDPVHAIITCEDGTCQPVGRCNWRLDLVIGPDGALYDDSWRI